MIGPLRSPQHVCYVCHMKRQFTVRARLVCYMELEDLNRLTALAREEGKTLVEWARVTLLSALDSSSAADSGATVPVKGAGKAARSRRRTAEPGAAHEIVAPGGSVSQMGEVRMAPAAEGRCAHGKRAGEVCYKCDERFGFPGLGG